MSVKEQFENACANGKLEKAKELLKNNPDINISADYEWAFICSCLNGHLNVSKWLLQTKPDIDISAYNEYAFRWACYNRHLHVAQWLQTLLPFKYIVIVVENDTIIEWKIRNKHETHLLHLLHAFTKNGYKNLHSILANTNL